MAIDWIDGGRVIHGASHIRISHSMNGLSDDVACQELALLRGINESLTKRVSYVGLLSNSREVQTDSNLLRKIGLWDSAARSFRPQLFADRAAYFSIALKVVNGVCFFGGVLAGLGHFQDIVCIARQMPVSLFIWGGNKNNLIHYFDILARQDVFVMDGKDRKCHVSHEVLSDICRKTNSFICIPTLEDDVEEADFVIIDPLSMVLPYLETIVGR